MTKAEIGRIASALVDQYLAVFEGGKNERPLVAQQLSLVIFATVEALGHRADPAVEVECLVNLSSCAFAAALALHPELTLPQHIQLRAQEAWIDPKGAIVSRDPMQPGPLAVEDDE